MNLTLSPRDAWGEVARFDLVDTKIVWCHMHQIFSRTSLQELARTLAYDHEHPTFKQFTLTRTIYCVTGDVFFAG